MITIFINKNFIKKTMIVGLKNSQISISKRSMFTTLFHSSEIVLVSLSSLSVVVAGIIFRNRLKISILFLTNPIYNFVIRIISGYLLMCLLTTNAVFCEGSSGLAAGLAKAFEQYSQTHSELLDLTNNVSSDTASDNSSTDSSSSYVESVNYRGHSLSEIYAYIEKKADVVLSDPWVQSFAYEQHFDRHLSQQYNFGSVFNLEDLEIVVSAIDASLESTDIFTGSLEQQTQDILDKTRELGYLYTATEDVLFKYSAAYLSASLNAAEVRLPGVLVEKHHLIETIKFYFEYIDKDAKQ